ncbi:MAG: electron transfer flavoprotein subunit beta, partial [Bacteroidales bacterium]
AIDGDTAQVGPQMAEHLGLPQVSYVAGFDVKNGKYIVKKETEEGYQMLEVESPALVTVLASAYKARYMNVSGIVDSYGKEVEIWGADKIDIREEQLGLKGSPTRVQKAFTKGLKQAGEVFEVDAEEAVGIIVSKLKEKFII